MSDNKTDLNLVDKLFLLALDDEKGTFVSDSIAFGYCVAGAVLFELSLKERIEIIDNKIRIANKEKLNDETLDYCLIKMIESKKERKISYWIESIGNRASKLRKTVLEKLISMGILEEKEDKILWIFTDRKYPSKNDLPENELRQKLTDIIVNDSKVELDEIMIISLVDSCGLNKEVYGKEIAKAKAKKIKSIIKDYEFADITGKLIKEIYETILAVLFIIITTTTVTTTSS